MSVNSRLRNLIIKNQTVSSLILNSVRKTGFDILHGPNPEAAILKNYGVNIVFDIGANVGQYAMRIKTLGYEGRIVSFEPISSVFKSLQRNAKSSRDWDVLNVGLSDSNGKSTINIANNSAYSSLLERTTLLDKNDFEGSHYVDSQEIKLKTLDSIFYDFYKKDQKVLVKLDVQGYEKKVLKGAVNSFKDILAIQLELSFASHYKEEPLIMEMIDYLSSQGFTLIYLKPLSPNLENGSLFQADGIFFNLEKVK